YKEAFLHGSTENSRIRAAILLLRSKDKTARDILLNALSSAENPVAGTAVCKALIQLRSLEKTIPDTEDFFEPLLA
ncbi:MAG: hypothetical protein ABIG61_09155, partial [Planctomycetota bacterium]